MFFVVRCDYNYRNSDVVKNDFKGFLDEVFDLMDGSKRIRCFAFINILRTSFRGVFFKWFNYFRK